MLSQIDWDSEEILVMVGGQQTLDDIGTPVTKKRLMGYSEKTGMVQLKFADGTTQPIPYAEFVPIQKQWTELQSYQLGRGSKPEK